MSSENMSKVKIFTLDDLPPDDTDWGRVRTMTDEEVEVAARSDPDAQPLTDEQLARMRRLTDVKALRLRLGMSQDQFSTTYRIPIGTLRDWEHRRTTPDALARAYLAAIESIPDAVATALNRSAA